MDVWIFELNTYPSDDDVRPSESVFRIEYGSKLKMQFFFVGRKNPMHQMTENKDSVPTKCRLILTKIHKNKSSNESELR